MNVAVIGGGVSGLRAALTLARAGARVTLFEKNAHLGGRVFSFPTPDFGEVDIGQHIWLRACTEFEQLLTDLGVPDAWVYRQDRVAMTYRWADGSAYHFAAGRGPAALASLGPLLGVPHLSLWEKLRYVWAGARAKFLSRSAVARLDDLSAADWLRQMGQPPAVVAVFWEPFLVGVCNARLDEISANHALTMMRLTLLHSPRAAAICLFRVPLSAVFDRLAREALAQAGVEVLSGAGVTALRPGTSPTVKVRGGGERAFDRVILAMPMRAQPLLGPTLSLPSPAEGGIVGLLLRFAGPVIEEPFFTAVGSPIQHAFDKTWVRGVPELDGSQVVELVLSAAGQEAKDDVDQLTREMVGHLAKHLPRVARTPLLARRRVTHGAATFQVGPGAEAQRRALPRWIAPGVALAGDYAGVGLPSTMEAAVRAGQAAALEVQGRAR